VAAELFGGLEYQGERLRDAWIRVLWHQFHDDLTGTCILRLINSPGTTSWFRQTSSREC